MEVISNVIFTPFSILHSFFVIRKTGVVILDDWFVEIWEIKSVQNRSFNKLGHMC